MNKFFSSLLGSFVGTWIAFLVFGIVIFISGLIMMTTLSVSSIKTPVTKISSNSVLRIDLAGYIPERPQNKSLQEYINGSGSTNNLFDILNAIEDAKYNDNISGIYIHCGAANAGLATSKSIRDALQSFKKESGKWIYAYGEMLDQNDYYIASVADSIFMNPVGMLDIHGLASTIPFYKGFLDKLGVEMQIIRVGTYKSAVEPYMLTSMSEANKLQTQTFLNNIWDNISDSIASSRNISKKLINEYADSLKTFDTPNVAIKDKFIDGLCYAHEFESKIKNRIGIDKDDDIKYVSINDVVNSSSNRNTTSSNEIAVLYAEGDIVVSSDKNSSICSDKIVPEILDLAKNDNVKGLVLRVNSPGGSAYASEQIWEALEQFKKTGKPFAVSMGDYAASGGYYISCGAQQIFAEPTTITGSIGIFAMIPSFGDLLNNKLGVNFEFVTTNANSDMSVVKPLTPVQRNAFQNYVNQGYELFTSRCAKGRNMNLEKLKSIAEGRVWDATEAKKIGLIDQYGNVNDAIEWVASKAGVADDYQAVAYPEFKEDFISLFYSAMSDSYYKSMKEQYGTVFVYFDEINNLLKQDKLQCRMENFVIR